MSDKIGFNIKIDKETKKQFEDVCSRLGLSVSSVLNLYAKTVADRERIPFDVSIDHFYSQENMRYLANKVKEMKEGKLKLEEHELIENDESENLSYD